MKYFFSTKERHDQLEASAKSWLKTPWCANSAAKGERGGVACHNLPRSIYIQCGALPWNFPEVVGDPNGSKHSKVSVIEKFIDSQPQFKRLDLGRDILAIGDLIGLRICRCVDHLGVKLSGDSFIHVLMHKKTDIDKIIIPPWQQRLIAAWRVIE